MNMKAMSSLWQHRVKKILTTNFQRAHVEESLLPFIEEKDGRYYYRHDFHAALVSWQPK